MAADHKVMAVRLAGRRREVLLAQRRRAQDEQRALERSLVQAAAAARRQGVAFDEPAAGESGAILTARDGFTWLCGSPRRKAQLNQAQIAAGLAHRSLIDQARGERLTADYGRLETGGGGLGGPGRDLSSADAAQARRLSAARRLAEMEAMLAQAHPALEMIIEQVLGQGLTLTTLAAAHRKPEPALLETLRLALDKLAQAYGYRTPGGADRA